MGCCVHVAGLQRLFMSWAPQRCSQVSSRRSLDTAEGLLSAARGTIGVLLTTVILRMHSSTAHSQTMLTRPRQTPEQLQQWCSMLASKTTVATTS